MRIRSAVILEGSRQAEHFAGTMGAQQLKGYFFEGLKNKNRSF
jgi:hypothetical protein